MAGPVYKGYQLIFTDGTTTLTPYLSYQAVVSQSGTSDPTTTATKSSLATGTTFAWTRVGVGNYLLTASTAVFTANKTVVLGGLPISGTTVFDANIVSTTVLSVTSSVLGITVPVTTPVLGAAATDGQLNNTLIEVRVYQ